MRISSSLPIRPESEKYDCDSTHRIAEISYDEDTEQTLLDKMKKPLEIRGWSMDNGVGGWAAVEVEDMEEYKEFMKDYKEIKRAAKNWIKFGF